MFALSNHLFSTAKEKEDHQDWLTVHCKTAFDHRCFILVKTHGGGGGTDNNTAVAFVRDLKAGGETKPHFRDRPHQQAQGFEPKRWL